MTPRQATMNRSLEQYEPERLDPNRVDPNYSPDDSPEVWNQTLTRSKKSIIHHISADSSRGPLFVMIITLSME